MILQSLSNKPTKATHAYNPSTWENGSRKIKEFKASVSYSSKFLTDPDFMRFNLKNQQLLNELVEEEVRK